MSKIQPRPRSPLFLSPRRKTSCHSAPLCSLSLTVHILRMENMEIKYEQSQRQEHGYNESQDHWGQTSGYSQAHQQTSGLDYISFALSSPHLPVGNTYANSLNRPLHHQPQHLIMPQWPSMMTSQATYVTPSNAAAPFVPLPMSTPIPVTRSHASHTGSTPRRTLTDADRRRMCQYHEEHPTTKQSEIGGRSNFAPESRFTY